MRSTHTRSHHTAGAALLPIGYSFLLLIPVHLILLLVFGSTEHWSFAVTAVAFVAAGFVIAGIRSRPKGPTLAAWAEQNGWAPIPAVRWLMDRWEMVLMPRSTPLGELAVYGCADPRGTAVTFTHVANGALHAVMVRRPVTGPMLSLHPEFGVNRIAHRLGVRELEIESDAFNKRWAVYCQDERYGHAVLSPRFLERLMQPDTDGLGVLIEGEDLVVYAQGPARPLRVPEMTTVAFELQALLPTFTFDPAPAPPRVEAEESDWPAPRLGDYLVPGSGGTGFLPASGRTPGTDIEPGRSWHPGP